MLSESEVERVRALLAQAYSYVEIQEITGIGRGAIGQIARGERPDYEALRRRREEEQSVPDRTGPKVWCHGCGHSVYPPCQYCRTLKAMDESPRREPPADDGFDEPRQVELGPKQRARYEKIRARKLRDGPEGLDEES